MRFYLHSHRGRDENGFDSEDHDGACNNAGRHLAELIRDDPGSVWDADWKIELTDEKGMTLALVYLVGTCSPALRR